MSFLCWRGLDAGLMVCLLWFFCGGEEGVTYRFVEGLLGWLGGLTCWGVTFTAWSDERSIAEGS